MFVTLDGTILGWNPNVDLFNAVVLVNRNGKASYTGMTTAEIGDLALPIRRQRIDRTHRGLRHHVTEAWLSRAMLFENRIFPMAWCHSTCRISAKTLSSPIIGTGEMAPTVRRVGSQYLTHAAIFSLGCIPILP